MQFKREKDTDLESVPEEGLGDVEDDDVIHIDEKVSGTNCLYNRPEFSLWEKISQGREAVDE